jgi:hypothetical protein
LLVFGSPSLSECSAAPVPFNLVLALAIKLWEAEELVNNQVFGPIKGRGDMDFKSLTANARFAYIYPVHIVAIKNTIMVILSQQAKNA